MKKLRLISDSDSDADSDCGPSLSLSGATSGGFAGGQDRLTSLPDSLRLHILSLLPLRSAIRTSALSSHWRHLWTHRWPHPSTLQISPSSPSSSLDQIPLTRPLHSLHVSLPPSSPLLPSLPRLLSSCHAEYLHLDLSQPSPSSSTHRRPHRRGAPPAFPFSSSSRFLTLLSLSGFRLSSPPSAFKKLTSLEVLSLSQIHLSDSALRRIVAACPLLRILSLRQCRTLRKVVIPGTGHWLSRIKLLDCPKVSEVSVAAPNLKAFHFSGRFLGSYEFEHPLVLEDVYVSCGGGGGGLPQTNWVKVLSGFGRIGVLTLCSLSLQYIAVSGANAIVEFRTFWNLRELQLLMVMMAHNNLMDIYSFFRLCHCPCLEKLFIELPTHMHDPYMEMYLEVIQEEPPEGVFRNLRIIKINSFKGHHYEMQLVKFLLAKATCLESLIIIAPKEHLGEEGISTVDSHSQTIHFLHVQISLMAKASLNVQIILSEHDDLRIQPVHREVYWKV